jgi:hypothetical protein
MLHKVQLRVVVLFLMGLVAILFAQSAYASTVPVTNTLDSGPGSLRQAVLDAAPGNTVVFSQDVFSVAQTISLTTGQIEISKSLTIDGAAVVTPTISGNGWTRVFTVSAGISVTLSRLLIVNGVAYGGAGVYNAGILTITHSRIASNESLNVYGGGAYNAATGKLTLVESALSYNQARGSMGFSFAAVAGIYSDGLLTVVSSTIDHNDQRGIANNGAAIVVNSMFDSNYGSGIGNVGTLSVGNSTFVNNYGEYSKDCVGAGGIGNGGTAVVINSTFADNIACTGGGIVNGGTLRVINSTFTGNQAFFFNGAPPPYNISGKGGAIANIGTLNMLNVTLSGNEADVSGAGVYNYAAVTLTNSIIANSITGSNCGGIIIDGGHNLEDANTCGFSLTLHSLISTTPLLGPLQNNGGPTLTMAPLPGSPAINAGDNASCPATDQRGVSRPQGGICDIGAVESLIWPRAQILMVQK